MVDDDNKPIGIFDSGIGGLTVLASLYGRRPDESYIYIGDTARLPYGTKSPETVIKYSLGLTRALLDRQVKAIIIACNTASTHAFADVQNLAGDIPVISVIDPTAKAALEATRNGHIGVIATPGTVGSGIYERQSLAARPDLRVSSRGCQLLVALAEEGWIDNEIARGALHRYLDPMFDVADAPDTLVLGCTHFPVFTPLLREILGNEVTLIIAGLKPPTRLPGSIFNLFFPPSLQFLATDDRQRFAEGAAHFFPQKISAGNVGQIELQF